MSRKFLAILAVIALFTAIAAGAGCQQEKNPAQSSPPESNPTQVINTASVTPIISTTATQVVTGTFTLTMTESATFTITQTATFCTGTSTPTITATSTITMTPCPDLSFGNSAVMYSGLNADSLIFAPFTNSNSVKMTGFNIYSGGGNVICAITDSNGNVLAQTPSTAITNTWGWNSITITPIDLSPGTYYLGAVCDTDYGILGSQTGTFEPYTSPTTYAMPSSINFSSMGGTTLLPDIQAVCTCQ